MATVIWSPRALQDFDEICDYIARDSRKRALEFAERLLDVVEQIPDQPEAGSMVPEYDHPDLRERFLHSFRVIYRIIDEDRIELVTICRGARLLPPI